MNYKKNVFLLTLFLLPYFITKSQDYTAIRAEAKTVFLIGAETDQAHYLSLLDQLQAGGEFNSITYPSHNFEEEHLEKLVELTKAYAMWDDTTIPFDLTPDYEFTDLETEIVNALTWWFQNVPDHDPIAETPPVGWWSNEIGKQRELQKISVLFYDYLVADHFDTNGSNIYGLSLLEQINQDFQEDLIEPDDMDESYTGANKADIAATIITKGLLIDEIAGDDLTDDLEASPEPGGWIAAGRDHIACTMRFSNDDQDYDGIREDYSFQQHNRSDGRGFLYTGGYGQSFVENVATWGTILMKADDMAGTDFDFADADEEIFFNFLIEGYRWTIRGNTSDYSTNGRYIVRKAPNNMAIPVDDLNMVMVMAGDASLEIQDGLQQIINNSTAPYGPQIIDPDNKNKYFWTSDYVSHHEPGYFSSLRMCSGRTVGTESTGGENIKGFWLPFGCTYIYRHGNEYIRGGLEDPMDYPYIFPIMDWSKIPGVTSPAYVPEFNGCDGEGIKQNQSRTFVGSTGNGKYSVSAMDYRRSYDSDPALTEYDDDCEVLVANETESRIKGKKAWFHFGEEIIALGAGIEDNSGLNVHTTLNQSLKVTTPVHNDTAPTEELTHDNVAYVAPPYPGNPEGSDIEFSHVTPQSGSWFDIDEDGSPDVLSGEVFSAWIDHGSNTDSEKADYFYIIAPGQDAADYIDANAEVSVIRNDNLSGSYIQAVKKGADDGDVLVGIIYYPHPDADDNSDPFMPTYVPITGGLEFKTNKPCALLYDEINSEICISSPDRESPTIILTANSPEGTDEITFNSLEEGKTTCIGFSFPTITAHNIHSHCTDEGIANVDILVENISYDELTDSNGDYNIPNSPDLPEAQNDPSATVTPFSNNDIDNGVTTFDLVTIQKHILQISQLDSPYKMIAADANHSGGVSTIDMVDIRQVILQNEVEFPNNNSWRFVSADYEFLNPYSPFSEIFPESVTVNSTANFGLINGGSFDFKAIKIGDVNCSVDNANEDLLINPAPEIIIKVEDKTVSKDEIVEVPFKVQNFSDVEAYQLGIEFNSEVLEKQSIDAGDLNRAAEPENFGLTEVENGKIRSVWLHNDASNPSNTVLDTSLVDNSSMFEVTFKAKKDFTRASSAHKLSDLFRLNDDILANRAYSEKGVHNIKLVFVPEGSFDKTENGGALLSPIKCFPNPAEEQINFQLDLRTESDIQLQIFDPIGKLVTERELSLPAGVQTIDLKKLKAWDDGLYYYTIRIGEEMESGKFVKQ